MMRISMKLRMSMYERITYNFIVFTRIIVLTVCNKYSRIRACVSYITSMFEHKTNFHYGQGLGLRLGGYDCKTF